MIMKMSPVIEVRKRSALMMDEDGSGAQEEPSNKKKKKAADKQDASERPAKRRTADVGFGYTDIIEATEDVEGLTYRPRTAETREV